jgi:hypothetical protein
MTIRFTFPSWHFATVMPSSRLPTFGGYDDFPPQETMVPRLSPLKEAIRVLYSEVDLV